MKTKVCLNGERKKGFKFANKPRPGTHPEHSSLYPSPSNPCLMQSNIDKSESYGRTLNCSGNCFRHLVFRCRVVRAYASSVWLGYVFRKKGGKGRKMPYGVESGGAESHQVNVFIGKDDWLEERKPNRKKGGGFRPGSCLRIGTLCNSIRFSIIAREWSSD